MGHWLKYFMGIVLLSLSMTAVSAEEKQLPPAKNIDELKQQLEELIEHHALPGLGIAIVDRQQDRLIAGFGFADKEAERRASGETLFRIGSTSKMLVSLAALKLVEEGKLDLNSPLKQLAPELEFNNPWEATDPVRIVHLLEHTAGWDDIHLTEYANNDPTPLTLKQGLDFHPHSRESRWRPGTRVSYANSGPPAVAYVIEKITGMDFERYIEQTFFQPLDMMTATYLKPEDNVLAATLYAQGQAVPYWHIIMRPSGSINASARDMSQLVKFLIHRGDANGEEILTTESIRRMEQPKSSLAARNGLKLGYGLSNYTSTYKNFVFHGHNGGVNGGLAELSYLPREGIGYAFMLNADNGAAMRAISDAVRAYITYGLSGPKLPEVHQLSSDKAKAYSGYYRPVNPRQELARFLDNIFGVRELVVYDNQLTINGNTKKRYFPVNEKMFRLEEESQASVIFFNDQQGSAVQVGGRYLQKISAFEYWLGMVLAWTTIVLIVLQFLWALVWGVRKLNKSIGKGPVMQIRIWPFFASLSAMLMVVFFIVGQVIDVFAMLGNVSWVSVGIMLSTYAFAITAVIGLLQTIRYLKHDINTVAKLFCLLSSLMFVIATIYCASYGIIGLQTFG